MEIRNADQEVRATTYWGTEHARRGYLYLSFNGGALRVLVPEPAAGVLAQLPPEGTPCEYLQEGLPEEPGMPALVWDDDPARPFRIAVSRHQVDRRLPPEDGGREVPLIWYVPDPARGLEAVREVRRERVRLVVGEGHEERVLAAPSCVLELFTLGPGGEPVRATPSREALEAVATDPGSHWIPNPAGTWSLLARRGRPPGTGGWHCLLAASEAGGSPLLVRLLWSGDSLLAALRDLESAAWSVLSRRFVCAAVAAHRLGRDCHGAEAPAVAAVAPWGNEEPAAPPPPLGGGKRVDETVQGMLEALVRGDAPTLPARGTDACRVGLELGRLVWAEENVRRIAAAWSRRLEAPDVLIWAVALHAAVRGVREVEACGVRVRAGGLQEAVELWAQWAEWLHSQAPAEFVRWVCLGGAWRPSRLVEPEDVAVPEVELCRSVRRALLEEAEKKARYAPWGAFVLEVPEEVFLHRWGVRELWLWVDGQKMWCAVAGEDGAPHESFLWTVRDGVATTLVVPPGPGEALGAVLAAVWHDMVVAGEESVPEAKPGRAARVRASGAAALSGPPRAVVLPGSRRSGVELRGVRRWGAEEEVAAVRRAHPVRGHLRRLEGGRKASEAARKAAGEYGIVLPDGRTFVRPHVRGGRGEVGAAEPPRLRARGLATVAAVLG